MNNNFEQQWLNGLPSSWMEKRGDFLCTPNRTTVNPEIFGDDLVSHYSIPQVQETGGPLIEPASNIDSIKLLVDVPTLLVSKLNPRKKTICIAKPNSMHPTLASGEFVPIRSDQMDLRYAYYLWCSEKVTDRLSAIVQSATKSHQRVNPADILKLTWKWPPLAIQRKIAQFLDERTAQIDGLLKKKQRLLDLLTEKRQAIITQAIIRGIDEMNRFSTLPLKRLLRTVSPGAVSIKGNLDELADDEGFPAYSASGQDVRLLKPQFSGEGIVLSSVGAQCGKCFYASGKWGIVANTQAFFPTKLADARYLFYLVNQQDFWEISGTAQPYVQVPMSMAKAVPAPPLATQRRIVQFLDEKTAQIDKLHSLVAHSINKLFEYRSALITAAVTGQMEKLR